ncbi:MAG: hypothetical protein QOF06_1431 [Solirubrobacterales bacterium]|jgi:hypothetical protein|nr:hypothetical protein [Solirubrobacterales bacterium]MEA2330308.1 hypothetical protein [Thermoleophilaceae bacterium]
MTEIGPVQPLSIGLEPGANFEGRIADELVVLEPEIVAAVEPELAAMSAAIEETVPRAG